MRVTDGDIQIQGCDTEGTWLISYQLLGDFRGGSRWEPAEEPEVDLTEVSLNGEPTTLSSFLSGEPLISESKLVDMILDKEREGVYYDT